MEQISFNDIVEKIKRYASINFCFKDFDNNFPKVICSIFHEHLSPNQYESHRILKKGIKPFTVGYELNENQVTRLYICYRDEESDYYRKSFNEKLEKRLKSPLSEDFFERIKQIKF